tara:strand:- start:451 stop:783 length:333 start_codon:yes stop_codon:yes gene_type:complete
MNQKTYAMRLDNLLYGIKQTGENLDFLCSLVEDPSEKYQIPDAIEYSNTVVCLMNQLTFMTAELDHNNLTEDGEHIILTKKQVTKLSDLSDLADEAVEALRECGISLAKN